MLYVQFNIDNERYLVATQWVIMLMPLVQVQPVAKESNAISGCMIFKGEAVPVIDVVQLLAGRQARRRMSTRIIVISIDGLATGANKLGLLVEKVSELMRLEETKFSAISHSTDSTPVLGAQAQDEFGVLQRIEPVNLLSQIKPETLDCRELSV